MLVRISVRRTERGIRAYATSCGFILHALRTTSFPSSPIWDRLARATSERAPCRRNRRPDTSMPSRVTGTRGTQTASLRLEELQFSNPRRHVALAEEPQPDRKALIIASLAILCTQKLSQPRKKWFRQFGPPKWVERRGPLPKILRINVN